MNAHPTSRRSRRRNGGISVLLFALVALFCAGAYVVYYLLRPTWPGEPATLNAPPIPVTIAGTLFEVPPAAIRVPLQRHPGPHERIDLAFIWPSLQPPRSGTAKETEPLPAIESAAAAPTSAGTAGLLFVTIEPLGSELSPAERLRSVYPRYVAAQPSSGPAGLVVLPFQTGTPYEGQDVLYSADDPDRFFALCTRPLGPVPGMCLHERVLGGAEVTLRFPRQWLDRWRPVADGFDRLMAQLHPQS
jgi:hypothetical protein